VSSPDRTDPEQSKDKLCRNFRLHIGFILAEGCFK
jgi:hypothetical protein